MIRDVKHRQLEWAFKMSMPTLKPPTNRKTLYYNIKYHKKITITI